MSNKPTLKSRVSSLKLNYKTEIVKIVVLPIICFLIGFICFLIFKKIFYLLCFTCLSLVLIFLTLNSYKEKERKIINDHDEEFVHFFTYFQIYMSNGFNVYRSLEFAKKDCSSWMEEKISILLKEIDEDKSVQPFVNFANNFKNLAYESVVLTIYQIIDDGTSSLYFNKFNSLFEKINKEHEMKMLDRKKRTVDTLNSFPIIGASLITVLLLFGILGMIGDLINGF